MKVDITLDRKSIYLHPNFEVVLRNNSYYFQHRNPNCYVGFKTYQKYIALVFSLSFGDNKLLIKRK